MARKKLPIEAFEYYFALGPGRSYRDVAEHFGASKTAVANMAEREGWQQRIAEREEKVRQESEQKSNESIEEMRARHLKLLRLMQHKALEVLQRAPLERTIDGIKTLDLVIRQERVARGEPSEHTTVTIEDTIKREYERWMVPPGAEEEAEAGGEDVDDLDDLQETDCEKE